MYAPESSSSHSGKVMSQWHKIVTDMSKWENSWCCLLKKVRLCFLKLLWNRRATVGPDREREDGRWRKVESSKSSQQALPKKWI